METTNQAEVKYNIAGQRIAEGQSRLTRNPKTTQTLKREPSYRLRKTFNEFVNGKPIDQAKVIGGYSPNTPSRDIQASKAWNELLAKDLADNELTGTHAKLLRSKNENIQIKALDLGYKVKNKYQNEEKSNQIINVQVNNLYERALKDI